ncbi:MAG: conjugal transfer protein TraD [Candidatus Obscuribacterales bacterium]|nr:conjugal transfer protein TraD [Candidatus Obscuribacterales bacterium]
MGYTYAQRLNVIEQKRQKLERQLADLERKEKTISACEKAIVRKELARQKYRLGGLILLASEKLGRSLSDEVLLGALLQIHTEQEPDKLKSWERYGAGLLKTQRQEVKESASAQGFTQSEVRGD